MCILGLTQNLLLLGNFGTTSPSQIPEPSQLDPFHVDDPHYCRHCTDLSVSLLLHCSFTLWCDTIRTPTFSNWDVWTQTLDENQRKTVEILWPPSALWFWLYSNFMVSWRVRVLVKSQSLSFYCLIHISRYRSVCPTSLDIVLFGNMRDLILPEGL